MLLALIVFFIVLPIGGLVTCVVCAGVAHEHAKDVAAGHATVVPATPPPPPLPVAPALAPASGADQVRVGFASFPKDSLLNKCAEATIALPPDVDADGAHAVEEAFATNFVIGTTGWTRIGRPCTEQFRTNDVLATCTDDLEEEVTRGHRAIWFGKGPIPPGTYRFRFVSRYYNIDTLTANDEAMKDCLDNKGAWEIVDKDSREWRDAMRARARRNIEKGLKALGQ